MNWYKQSKIILSDDMNFKDIRNGLVGGMLGVLPMNNPAQGQNQIEQKQQVVSPQKNNIKQEVNQSLNMDDVVNFITQNEGFRSLVYKDTKGIPTIGYGFNLNTPYIKNKIKEIGLDYNLLFQGKQEISEQQSKRILLDYINQVINPNIPTLFPNFEKFPNSIKKAIYDLYYNLGNIGLSKFKNFIHNVNLGDYKTASNDLRDSKWFSQVKSRAGKVIDLVEHPK